MSDAIYDGLRIPDNGLLKLGNDQDGVLLLRSATLAANTALTGVLVGTPVSQALAANSVILSNITASGDVGLYVNNGGNSLEGLLVDVSEPALILGHGVTKVRIPDNVTLGFDTADGESTLKSDGSDTIWQFASGGLTIGLGASAPSPDNNFLHVWRGTAGVVIGNTGATLVLESDGHNILNFLTPDAFISGVMMGLGTNGAYSHILQRSDVGGDPLEIKVCDVVQLRWTSGVFAFQLATTISTTTGALTLAPTGGSLLFTGTLALTGSRVTQSYHTNITSTNAVTVDSWSRSKFDDVLYAEDALAILRKAEVIAFRHNLDRDASGRLKLGIRAESIREPLALVYADYGFGLGEGPMLDTMGLMALNTRAIQQVDDRMTRLERQLVAAGITPEE